MIINKCKQKKCFQIKRKEDEAREKLIEECRRQREMEEMRTVEPAMKQRLFEGFSREERGRYDYLKARKYTQPETRYTRPVCSSWVYGWRLGDQAIPDKSKFTRTKIVRDTFYTNNGIPDLPVTTEVPSRLRRCQTAAW